MLSYPGAEVKEHAYFGRMNRGMMTQKCFLWGNGLWCLVYQ